MIKNTFRHTNPTQLGRWALTTDKSIIDRKIEMSNYDHCGTCPTMKKKDPDIIDESVDISLYASQSFHSYPNSSKKKHDK